MRREHPWLARYLGNESVLWEQLPNGYFECAGNGLQLQQRDISHSPLDPRHVRAVQAGVVGKVFLRQATPDANLADSISDLPE